MTVQASIATTFIAAALVLLVGVPAATAQTVRDDPLDDAWAIGHLAWTNGHGAIAWTPEFTTDPSTPVPDKTTQLEFVGAPLPWTLYFNASRNVQVDFYLRTDTGQGEGKCYLNDFITTAVGTVVLYANGKPVGYGPGTQEVIAPYHRAPAGFSLCRYRFPVEIRSIPAGSILTLKFTDSAVRQFGLGDIHDSVIRIPFYLPDDVYWRDPETVKAAMSAYGGDSVLGGVADALPASAPVVGAALATPSLRRNRGRAATFALLLLLTLGLSGCVSGHARPTQTPTANLDDGGLAAAQYQDATGLGIGGDGTGAVLGVVHDDLMIPVGGAHVSLLGTSSFTSTDGYGRFHLLNVTAGIQRLRIDRATYRPVETSVQVQPHYITKLDLTMLPLVATPADARPHKHDYWNGNDAIEIMNLTGTCPAGTPLSSPPPCTGFDPFSLPPKDIPGHNTIIPGTGEVDVRLYWDPNAIGVSTIGLNIQSDADPSFDNWTSYLPRGPGVPIHVITNWEMEDNGHQLFSTWRFDLVPDATPTRCAYPCTHVQSGDVPSVRIVIVLHRAVVPLESPHPDHWKGRTSAPLMNSQAFQYGTKDVLDPDHGCATLPVNHVDGYFTQNFQIPFQPNFVVPQGAGSILVYGNFSKDARGVVSSVDPVTWHVWYKTGEQPLVDSLASPKFVRGPDATTSSDGKNLVWRIPVNAGQADGIYNKRSAWQFFLQPDDVNAYCMDSIASLDNLRPPYPTVAISMITLRG